MFNRQFLSLWALETHFRQFFSSMLRERSKSGVGVNNNRCSIYQVVTVVSYLAISYTEIHFFMEGPSGHRTQ